MKHGRLLVVVSMLVLAAPTAVLAQGLGDAAARARQKRKEPAAAPPAKVYTDSDLDKSKPNGGSVDAAADAASPGSAKADDAGKPAADATADLDREREERK